MAPRLVLLAALASLAACDGDTVARAAPADPAPAARSASAEGSEAAPAARAATAPKGAAQAASGAAPEVAPPAAAPDTSGYRTVLATYVTDGGRVRYAALRAHDGHRRLLEGYVEAIASAQPRAWPTKAQLAFYINAYNALTLDSVLDLWPVESVQKEKGFFKGRKHRIAGRELTLDELENGIIREQFDEPRIHFAVNCASASCPPLADEPYEARGLDRMLEAQTVSYLRATTKLRRSRGQVAVSKIFEWFEADFEPVGGVRAFVAKRLPPKKAAFVRDESHRITYLPYDWSLNAAR